MIQKNSEFLLKKIKKTLVYVDDAVAKTDYLYPRNNPPVDQTPPDIKHLSAKSQNAEIPQESGVQPDSIPKIGMYSQEVQQAFQRFMQPDVGASLEYLSPK